MRLIDFINVFIILIIFGLLLAVNLYSSGIKRIKENWPIYRCKPSVMPFASLFGFDTTKNFNECVQTMQSDYMGILMQPINHTLSTITDGVGGVTGDLQNMRGMFSKLRGLTGGGFTNIYGIFLNIMQAFQKIIMKMKDSINKLFAVVFVVMYFILAAKDSLVAIVDGPVGLVFDVVCFHPDTKIMKKDKTLVKIKDVKLDDVLSNGSKVNGVLQLRNKKKNEPGYSPIYKIYSEELKSDVLVTGEHLFQHPKTNQFIKVKDYEAATETDIETEDLCCLITDDHLIQFGELTFWDWED